jgi:hypothetical protein
VISSGLVWPKLAVAVSQYCAPCSTCQLRARQLKSDQVPISIVEKAGQGQVFEYMHCDVFGPILPGQNVYFHENEQKRHVKLYNLHARDKHYHKHKLKLPQKVQNLYAGA